MWNTLSGRFLALTIIFVMLAEVLIFFPSVARFREDYLRERLERAQIASLALLATPDDMVEPALEAELLSNAGVLNIVLQRDQRRELVLSSPMAHTVEQSFDLRDMRPLGAIVDAVRCLLRTEDRLIRVIGPPIQGGGMVIEIMLWEEPLRTALRAYGERILLISVAISVLAAALLFLAVRRFITRPITRVAANMTHFQANPEDPARVIAPSSSAREIMAAEAALRAMQENLITALRQKDRLAALGGAVARISHDLRNILTTAQLLVDRIDASRDPGVKRVAPKLVASLDRAIRLCQRTLDFGRSEEPQPERRRVALHALVEDLLEGEALGAGPGLRLVNAVPPELMVEADPEQLFRVLSNLIRNARQAIEGTGQGGEIAVAATLNGTEMHIEVRDTGPGLPTKVLDHLFKPFLGSVRPGGSGLGLAIAAELVRGHGGRLEVAETSTTGTRFRLTLPHPTRARPAHSPLHPANPAAR